MDPNSTSRSPVAGGCLLSASIMTGIVVGLFYREISIGFLAGLAVGIILALAVWLIDRMR